MNKSALQYARPIRKNPLALGTMVLLISSIPALGQVPGPPVGALRPKRLLENLGLELKSQPETNAPDAAILQRRIGKAGPLFGEPSAMLMLEAVADKNTDLPAAINRARFV